MAWLKPFLLGVLATMSVSAAAATVAKDASAGAAITDQQILVMVRMAPAHFHPGAGYDGDYGGPQAESARKRLAKRIARRHDLALVDGWPMPLLDVDCFVMDVRGRSADAAATEVSRDPAVAWSQPMHLYRTQELAAPNDPLFAALTLHNHDPLRHVYLAGPKPDQLRDTKSAPVGQLEHSAVACAA